MKILVIGDVFGRPGRQGLSSMLSILKNRKNIDLCIANGENSSGGLGITQKSSGEMFKSGVDIITLGNHTWSKKEIVNFIDSNDKIIRPLNYPQMLPGKGSVICNTSKGKVGIINIQGRVYMDNIDCPFNSILPEIEKLKKHTNKIIVDFHAEATSEKIAMGWFLDSKVSAVVGTHTHVQTADEKILPYGTAYITDIGMTGPYEGVLGVDKELIIKKFTTTMPVKYEVADGKVQINAVIIEIDNLSGKAIKIERINEIINI